MRSVMCVTLMFMPFWLSSGGGRIMMTSSEVSSRWENPSVSQSGISAERLFASRFAHSSSNTCTIARRYCARSTESGNST